MAIDRGEPVRTPGLMSPKTLVVRGFPEIRHCHSNIISIPKQPHSLIIFLLLHGLFALEVT
jgi:hypothetical protein